MNRLISILTLTALISIPGFGLAQGIWTCYINELPGEVFDMAQDKYGNYWFATTNGVCELDTNGFWHYLVDTTVWDTTMYFKLQIEIDKKNNKWFVGLAMSHPTKEYVVKYDDSTFTYYNPSGLADDTWIASLGVDSSGHILAGSMDRWAYWFDGKQWHPFYVPGTFIYDTIGPFGTDKRGTFYISHDNGLSTLHGQISLYCANSFAFDNNNTMWFGGGIWGLGKYDGQNWTLYNVKNGLLSNSVTYAVLDSMQNIWVSYAEFAKGVSKFNGYQWQHLTNEDGLLSDTIMVLYVDKKGRVLFANSPQISKGLSIYLDTTTTLVSNKMELIEIPKLAVLHQNYPNPFNFNTMICYELHQENKTQLSILNIDGKEVIRLVSEDQQAGFHQVIWNGKDKSGKEVSSGVYFCVLKIMNFIETKKMILIR